MHLTKEGPQDRKAQPNKVRSRQDSKSLGAINSIESLSQSQAAHSRISKSRSQPLTNTTYTTMICNRCLRTAIQRPTTLPFRRALTTTTPILSTASPRTGNPDSSSHTPPAATSTGAAQPFSTPLSTSPSAASLQAPSNAEKAAPTVKSSVAAGTTLKGLNFVKGKNDPVALEDGEYPAWLWGILKKGKGGAEGNADAGSVEGDLFCMFCPTTTSFLPSFPSIPLFSHYFLTNLPPSHSQIQKTTPRSRQSPPQTTTFQPRSARPENPSARTNHRFTCWRWKFGGCD
jgi:hypothetical protein